MSDLDLALTTLLVGAGIGLYLRVWVVALAGLFVFTSAYLWAQPDTAGVFLKIFRSVEILVIFEIGYFVGAAIAVGRAFRKPMLSNDNSLKPDRTNGRNS